MLFNKTPKHIHLILCVFNFKVYILWDFVIEKNRPLLEYLSLKNNLLGRIPLPLILIMKVNIFYKLTPRNIFNCDGCLSQFMYYCVSRKIILLSSFIISKRILQI